MSRKANGDNHAIIDTFWSTLNNELIDRSRVTTRAESP